MIRLAQRAIVARAPIRAAFAVAYMQEWIGGAQAEDWVIEKFELPEG